MVSGRDGVLSGRFKGELKKKEDTEMSSSFPIEKWILGSGGREGRELRRDNGGSERVVKGEL